MSGKHSLLSYNDSYGALAQLGERWGDRLQSLDVIDKLQIVTVLFHWQALDTEFSEMPVDAPNGSVIDSYSLSEAIEDHSIELSDNALVFLGYLGGVRPEALLDLTIAICNQIKDEVRNA